MPRVNPEILRWARETAGLDAEEACRKLNLRPAKGISGPDRLRALENGEAVPSRALLGKMAKQYRRPLLTFYLPTPPRPVDRGEDLRSLTPDRDGREEALLDALLRGVRARQSMIRELMEEEDEATAVALVGAGSVQDGVQTIASRIREAIGLDVRELRTAPTPRDAFATLRHSVESAGIFVLLMGDLGSHHSGLSVSTFRGISLSDPVAPIIVINDRDSKAAWSFTLLHELTHIYLGQSSISGLWSDHGIERLCNDVASELLLPDSELKAFHLPKPADLSTLQRHVQAFAGDRNLSSSMVGYRLFRAGFLSKDQWQSLRILFRELWDKSVKDRRAKNRETAGGPGYYVVRRHRVGNHLVEFVARMLYSGAVTTTKAGRILGVKPTNVYPLVESTL